MTAPKHPTSITTPPLTSAAPFPTTNIRFAGLGGTGVIKASDILADVAFRCGHTVKKAEVHGMSQRGGSVQSDVRFGPSVNSPMIPDGACDFLVVLDLTQVAVVQGSLRPTGEMLTPESVPVAQLPSAKALNVALLGRLSSYFDFPVEVWHASLRAHFPEKLHPANDRAFDLGRAANPS